MLSVVQSLRDYTAQEMKPEMGPWAEEYTVKMEDIETKLKLTNPNTQPWDESVTSDYSKMFQHPFGYLLHPQEDGLSEQEKLLQDYSRNISLQGSLGTKILLTGEEGTGKTVLRKKIAYDWSKGKYVQFSIVFYVDLKQVRPAKTIENVIVDQYKSKILDINAQLVKRILNKVGDKCLVIVDGLDVPGQSLHSELIQSITGQRHSFLNVLVAARTDHTSEYHKQFHTKVAIEPFLYPALENIASDIAQLILPKGNSGVIHPSTIGSQNQLSDNNPMLRTFLYVLAGSNAIDLTEGKVSLGELFTKLVSHIYKSYEFRDYVVKVLGKLAFQALINPGKIHQDIPNNDPLLVEHPGNTVVFKQTSMQIYLAALYFVLEIDAEESVSSLFGAECTEPPMLTHYLFFYVALWSQNEKKMVFQNTKKVYEALVSFVKDHLDLAQLDFRDIVDHYPALDFSFAERQEDELVLGFLKDVISACNNTEVLFLPSDGPVEYMLPTTKQTFPKLKMIRLFQSSNTSSTDITAYTRSLLSKSESSEQMEINVILTSCTGVRVQQILHFLQTLSTPYSLHFLNSRTEKKSMVNVVDLLKGNIVKLSNYQNCFMFAEGNIDVCQHLTQLTFSGLGLQINKSMLTALRQAVIDKHLPKISHLDFSECGCNLKGKLQFLFETAWPTLTHFNVAECFLSVQDVRIICAAASDDSVQNSLPKLSSLAISPKYISTEGDSDGKLELFTKAWIELRSLQMFGVELPYEHPPETYPGYTAFFQIW